MKLRACFLLFAAPALASAITLNSSRQDVVAELGAPRGRAELGAQEILFYDQGQVRLVDGQVASFDLMSPAEASRLKSEQAASDARAAEERRQRIAQGEALIVRMLADPAFVAAPPDYQLSFWKNFHLRYPEVSCEAEYSMALARVQQQNTDQENQMADLDARVAEAEARAARAEQEAHIAIFSDVPPFIGFRRFHHFECEPHDVREPRHDRNPPKTICTFSSPSVNNINPPLKNPAGLTPFPFFPLTWQMQKSTSH